MGNEAKARGRDDQLDNAARRHQSGESRARSRTFRAPRHSSCDSSFTAAEEYSAVHVVPHIPLALATIRGGGLADLHAATGRRNVIATMTSRSERITGAV